MEIIKCKLRDVFKMLHDEANKQFYGNLVLMTFDGDGYPCALSDESVRYGTDDYALFEQAVRKDFPQHIAEQILEYEMFVSMNPSRIVALDTTISYFEDLSTNKERKILFVNAYPKTEFEETKRYKSGMCDGFCF